MVRCWEISNLSEIGPVPTGRWFAGWHRLLATCAAEPQEPDQLVVMTCCRFATLIVSNHGHPGRTS